MSRLTDYLATIDNPLMEMRPYEPPARERGAARYWSLVKRGATLGYAGAKEPPEGLGEQVAEFAGSTIPITAISAVATPATAAALRLARFAPTKGFTQIAGAGGAGAAYGGARAAVEGRPALPEAASEAALWAGGVGAFRALKALRGRKPAIVAPSAGEAASTAESVEATIETVETLPRVRATSQQQELPLLQQAELFERAPRVTEKKMPPLVDPGTFSTVFPKAEKIEFVGAGTLQEQLLKLGYTKRQIRGLSPNQAKSLIEEGLVLRGVTDTGELESLIAKGVVKSPFGQGLTPKEIALLEQNFVADVDLTTGLLQFSPRTPLGVSAVRKADILRPAQLDFPLGVEQLSFLQGSQGIGLRKHLDVISKKEPALTSNLVNKTTEEVDQVVQNVTGVHANKLVAMDLSPDGALVDQLLTKSGIPRESIPFLMEQVNKLKPNERSAFVLEWLRKRCK